MSRYPEFDLSHVQALPFTRRFTKVHIEQCAASPQSGASFREFLDSLPRLLAGDDVRRVAAQIVQARRRERAVVVSCGGHVIKCGLAPVLIDLMERGLITTLAVNGAVAIHDAEMALFGATSENVEQALPAGTFGLAAETAQFINCGFVLAQTEGLGAGETLGRALTRQEAPFLSHSLLAAGYRLQIPVTIHVAIGTDIVHMHPNADGAAFGEASLRDFRILTAAMRDLSDGGVLLNLGSAVLLPEVILKALALLRNEDETFGRFLGVDLDFIRAHRARLQVVQRAECLGGEGIALTGHHEIMIPLLAFAVLEAWEARAS